MIDKKIKVTPQASDKFPYKLTPSFVSIIKFWQKVAKDKQNYQYAFAKQLMEEVEKVPELLVPIEDLSIIERHKPLIQKLLINQLQMDIDTSLPTAIYTPFNLVTLLANKKFTALLTLDGRLSSFSGYMDLATSNRIRYQRVTSLILKKFYKVKNIDFSIPFTFKVINKESGLIEFYKLVTDTQYVEIKARHPLPAISDKTLTELIHNFNDSDLLKKHINPEHFQLEGFIIGVLINISEHELISVIRQDLLKSNSLTNSDMFYEIRQSIRSLFKLPDLELGIGIFNKTKDMVDNFGHTVWCQPNCKLKIKDLKKSFQGSVYQKLLLTKKPILCESLKQDSCQTELEEGLYSHNIRSYIIAPLIDEDNVIGYLELASPNPWELNPVKLYKLEEVLSIFSTVLKRSLEERGNELEAIIRQHFTTLHPSIEWKFVDAAENYLNNQSNPEPQEMETIILQNVYPLFGQADIKHSSIEGNEAIRLDFMEGLRNIVQIFKQSTRLVSLPALECTIVESEELIRELEDRKIAMEENKIMQFYKTNIQPYLVHLYKEIPSLREQIEVYDIEGGSHNFISTKRIEFEESVQRINDLSKEIIQNWQVKGQKICSHYFEKINTDGIEYNIYMGNSISPNETIDKVCLGNMRYWQLEMMCDLTQQLDNLAPTLKKPLRTAQLIYVFDKPIKLKFRTDEKRFDVEGAYNISYEIVKKRIDKAVVEDSSERITQPGKIAIIHNNKEVKDEYNRYIKHLINRGILEEEVEYLRIGQLQGVDNLKAIRVTVKNN